MGLLDLLFGITENNDKEKNKNINDLMESSDDAIYEDELEEDDFHFEDEE